MTIEDLSKLAQYTQKLMQQALSQNETVAQAVKFLRDAPRDPVITRTGKDGKEYLVPEHTITHKMRKEARARRAQEIAEVWASLDKVLETNTKLFTTTENMARAVEKYTQDQGVDIKVET